MIIPEITTDRLLLRPFSEADIDRVTELLQSPEIAQTTLYIPFPYTRQDAVTWIGTHRSAAELGRDLTWAICRKDDGLLMGAFGISIDAYHQRGTIGYWLGVPWWGQGFTSEAAQAVVEFVFRDLGLHRIDATHLPDNIGSARVMEKAGLVYEGTLRGYFRKGDRFVDAAMHGRVRDDADEARSTG